MRKLRLRRAVIHLMASSVISPSLAVAADDIAVISELPPVLSGNATVAGSLRQLSGRDLDLSGNALIDGDLLLPGTPRVELSGNARHDGIVHSGGNPLPDDYRIRLTGNSSVNHIRLRTDPAPLAPVPPPAAPRGTRDVHLSNSRQSLGDPATIRDLTVSGNFGALSLPPGEYRNVTLSGKCSLRLGIPGSTQPAAYNFRSMTATGQAPIEAVGPVLVHVGVGFQCGGLAGASGRPGWLRLEVAGGDANFTSGAKAHGFIHCPAGNIVVHGGARIVGAVSARRVTIHGNGDIHFAETVTNRPPVANVFDVQTPEDTPLDLVLSGSDPENGALTFTITKLPVHGTLTGDGPNLRYLPNPDYHGPDEFTFTVSDGALTSSPAAVRIDVEPVNDPPIMADASVQSPEDTDAAVLIDASDIDGDSLTYTVAAEPQHGTVTGTGPGFAFHPERDFHGADSFRIAVADGNGGTAIAVVR